MRILTIGTFDLLHEGHINLFTRCRALAGKHGTVIIGVNSDAFVTQYKGAVPWVPEYSRLQQVRAYGEPHLHEGSTPDFIIQHGPPNYIVIGSDWARKDYLGQLAVTQDWLDEKCIGIIYAPLVPNISSTLVKERHRPSTITFVE
jgi:cytidyltransferase-like protein